MRQIKFRGKRLDNGKWVYGTLGMSATKAPYILWSDGDIVIEDPIISQETVGQFTGLRDRNGVGVYEGDVVFWITRDMRGRGRGEQGAIFWDEHTLAWAIERDKPCIDGRPCIITRPFEKLNLEVIGNIWDNPELMGDE